MAVSHKCSSQCIAKEKEQLRDAAAQYVVLSDGVLSKSESPFAVPFELGWQRSEYGYTAPCGLKRYTLSSIQRFLFRSGSRLSIDQFNLDQDFNCFITQGTGKVVRHDVAQGSENLPIACVNDVDCEDISAEFTYCAHRLPADDVDLNVGLVSGCGCSDSCVNKLKCHCRLLTEEADDLADVAIDSGEFGGYSGKSLTKLYIPGLYECNQSCSCGPRCQNRVSEEGIKAQLQVFRLKGKGWGLRCLHDLPGGYFVCLYSGEVMSSRKSDAVGPERGDEYFVSLNLIEMVEQKLGYESDVDFSFPSSTDSLSVESDDSLLSSISDASRSSSRSLISESGAGRVKRRRSQEDSVCVKKMKKSSAGSSSTNIGGSQKEEFVKVRRHLAEKGKREVSDSTGDVDSDDEGYVIDAKWKGNVGRFLNHSCSPNCQLQNLFTDTHDPRFPVMGFFTARKVSALEELTWDYLYEDGVEVFDCVCGSVKCKSRAKLQPEAS